MSKLRWTIQFIALVIANIGFLQILKIGVCGPFFYCYGCPAAAFACPIGVLQNYAIFEQFPFYALGTLGLFGLALGRFWCGWVCPFGTVQDIVMWFRRREDYIKAPRVPWTKFLVLAIVLLVAWLATDTLFCKICPAGSLFAAFPYYYILPSSSEWDFGIFLYIHLITLVIALVVFYLIGRFWCRYLCPLGSIFAVFNRISILKIKLDLSQCTHCRQCMEACPVNIEDPEDIESSTDCIRCGKCIEACQTKALRISASLKD